jgi:hypothetical protein
VLGEDDLHRLLEYRARRTRLAAKPDRHLGGVNAEEFGQALAPAAHDLALAQDGGAHFRPAGLVLHSRL